MELSFLDKDHWNTLDGRKLYPEEFEDKHLLNTIKYIKDRAITYADEIRVQEEMYYISCPEPRGDMAGLAYKQGLAEMMNISDEEWLNDKKIYKLLKEEAVKRKLL